MDRLQKIVDADFKIECIEWNRYANEVEIDLKADDQLSEESHLYFR